MVSPSQCTNYFTSITRTLPALLKYWRFIGKNEGLPLSSLVIVVNIGYENVLPLLLLHGHGEDIELTDLQIHVDKKTEMGLSLTIIEIMDVVACRGKATGVLLCQMKIFQRSLEEALTFFKQSVNGLVVTQSGAVTTAAVVPLAVITVDYLVIVATSNQLTGSLINPLKVGQYQHLAILVMILFLGV